MDQAVSTNKSTAKFKSLVTHGVIGSLGLTLILIFGMPIHRGSTDIASRPLFAPPEIMKHFTFGYGEVSADSLWLRVIQDFDYCEATGHATLLSAEEAKRNDEEFSKLSPEEQKFRNLPPVLSEGKNRISTHSKCNKGWVFQYINLITELAPRFRMPYIAGGTMMSILVDDREGARVILEKGIRQFPDDWTISYRAAYHYLYEVNNPERAAELLALSAQNGAPQWAYALAAKLYTVTGRAQLGKSVLEDALAMDPNGPGAERIRQRLDEINKILAQGEPEAGKSQ